jgi:hypothetical protein
MLSLGVDVDRVDCNPSGWDYVNNGEGFSPKAVVCVGYYRLLLEMPVFICTFSLCQNLLSVRDFVSSQRSTRKRLFRNLIFWGNVRFFFEKFDMTRVKLP